MRRARIGVALVAVGVAQLLLATRGQADAPTKVAWWNEAQQAPAPLPTVPAPPSSPDGGITLVNAPNGPAAWGAVSYPVGDIAGATLTLTSSTPIAVPNGDGVLACLIDTPRWQAGGNQRWDTRPVVDPLCTPGAVDTAGTVMTFKVTAAFRDADGALDVAIIPTGQLPFTVNFVAPDAASLHTAPATTPADAGAPADSPAFGGTVDIVDGTALFPDTQSFAFATPPHAASPNRIVSLGGHPTLPAAVAAARHPRSERVAVVLILVGLLISLWRLAGQTVRAPRLLGSLGGPPPEGLPSGEASVPAGIGRFTRDRTERPRRLT